MHAPQVDSGWPAGLDLADRLVHLQTVPARDAVLDSWPEWAHPEVVAGLARARVPAPWRHQREAAELAHGGSHLVISTGTASGKSLGYLLPGLSAVLAGRGTRGQRGSSVLYLAPTKALAADQGAAVRALETGVRVATHDGDSSPEERSWTRDHAEYVLTNPDMLHRSLLPDHERWGRFFGTVDYVVIDEAHRYRGVFGAHVAQVLRRLRRVCAAHGSDPTFVLASATMAEPEASAGRLIGLPVSAVTDDASPRGPLTVALLEPPFTGALGELGAPVRRAVSAEVADLLAALVERGVRTLAFVRSRQGTEVVALRAKAALSPALRDRVAAYRGGYLPEERRALEEALRGGRLLGLATTNALELGIDVAGLDAVVLAGFPGTRAAFWQQVGRAGRGGQAALALLVARDDPLDSWLVHHPEDLLGAPVEATVFDPDNPHVLGPHLCAAAAEIPLTDADVELFGVHAAQVLAELTETGLLRRRPRGWFWTDRSRASDLADIRSSGGAQVRLLEQDTGRVVGTVEAGAAHAAVHEGAVLLHLGETWLVHQFDEEEGVAFAEQRDPGYTTSALDSTDLEILAEQRHRAWGPIRLATGRVRLTRQVTSYLVRDEHGQVRGQYALDLPPRSLETVAVWWVVPSTELADLTTADLPGAAHAAEHASIGLLPLFATCDRWDIGGLSTALHPDTGELTVFVHDGHPGGAGFAARGFEQARTWLGATRELIASCECAAGCPACIQSPKCGNGNQPLDKAGAIELLDLVLSHAPAADD